MESFWQDLRYAARALAKKPAFTLIAVVTLGLGIGANTAIFSVIYAVLLKPLPYQEPERLMTLWESHPLKNIEQQAVQTPNLADWRAQNQSFEDLAYWYVAGNGELNIITGDGTEKARAVYTTASLFSTLRVTPHLGNLFAASDDQSGGNERGEPPRAALLSYDYWQRQYAADADIIGRQLTIDTFGRRAYTIVGVLPQGFDFPAQTAIWLQVGWQGIPADRRRGRFVSVLARLQDGVSREQAQAEMNTIQGRIAEQYPEATIGSHVRVIPLLEQTLGRNLRAALLVLWGVVALVLLIACANVANLLLARAADRQKEIAIRLALGGSRWRLMRQLLTESLLLAFIGGAFGVLLAHWGLKLLIAFNADHVPRLGDTALNNQSLAFTLLVAVLTGLLFGLAPAWQTTKTDLHLALKDGARSSGAGWQGSRMRNLLVIAEVAISLVLLIGAGLMLRSFAHLTQVERGFAAEQLLTAEMDFSMSGFTSWVRATETRPQVALRDLIERLSRYPGVAGVAASGTNAGLQITVEHRQTGIEEDYPRARFQGVTPDYFRALGIPLLHGRGFTENDTLENPRVVILSAALAKRLFGEENPIGKRLYPNRLNPGQIGQPDRWTNTPALSPTSSPAAAQTSTPTTTSRTTPATSTPAAPPEQWTNISLWAEIVGVVADVKSMSVDPQVELNAYVPYWQWAMQTPTLFVRADGKPAELATALYAEVKALNKNLPPPKVRTMSERLGDVVAGARFQTLLLTLFGLLTLLLVSAGIYGVVSYSVAQRTHEIGVRLALGAQTSDVLRLVITQGLKLTLPGIVLGLAGSVALTRLMASLLYGVSATDPLTFTLAALLLIAVALAACYLPARRATKVDPLVALRYE